MGYLEKTAKGLGWVGGFRVTSRIIAFAKLAILARLLSPAQFGVYGIATLVLVFLEIFTETGINTVLIQEKKDINKYLDTAWVVSIGRGLLISICIILSSPLVARFFNSPDSLSLLVLISLVPLVRGFINPSVVKFQKELEFNKEFWFKITIFFFDAIAAIVITYVTRSPLGLIWGFIFGATVEVLLSFKYGDPRPRFIFDRSKFDVIVNKGKWMTGVHIFQYLYRQGDDVVVGKLLGTAPLGIYQAAYKLSSLPVSEVADVVGKVTFPIYVKMSSDKERLKKAFIKSFIVSLGVILVFSGILYFFSNSIVLLLLGQDWLEVEPVLKVLIIYGVFKAIEILFHSLFLSLELQKYVTTLSFVSMFFLAVTIIPFVYLYGVFGAAYSAIVGSVLSLPLTLYYTYKVLK